MAEVSQIAILHFISREDQTSGLATRANSKTRAIRQPTDLMEGGYMKIKDRVYQLGATGYILLWLLGIPVPILLLIFLLRGCT